MKAAPAVAYPTGAPVAEGWAIAGLAVAWLLAQAIWLHAHLEPWSGMPMAWWLSLMGGALLLAWSLWRLKALRTGQLIWSPAQDAGSWTLVHPDWPRGLALRQVRCAVDLNQLMVLELRSVSGLGVWVWCSQARRPSEWLALRRAVHAVRHKDLHVERPVGRN